MSVQDSLVRLDISVMRCIRLPRCILAWQNLLGGIIRRHSEEEHTAAQVDVLLQRL
jgi:hypothetical protein